MAVDSSGDLFISDTYDFIIREVVAATDKVKTVAGTLGTPGDTGDGGPATSATLYYPLGVAVNSAGTSVWVGMATMAATTMATSVSSPWAAASIPWLAAEGAAPGRPTASAMAALPSMLICMPRSRRRWTRRATSTSPIPTTSACARWTAPRPSTLLRGTGSTNQTTLVNGTSTGITLNYPWGIVGDPSGNMFVANQSDNAVQELVISSSLVNIFAGTGTGGYNGDGIPANTAGTQQPGRRGSRQCGKRLHRGPVQLHHPQGGHCRQHQHRGGNTLQLWLRRRWRSSYEREPLLPGRCGGRFQQQPLHCRQLQPHHPQGEWRHHHHGGGHSANSRLRRRRRPSHQRQTDFSPGYEGRFSGEHLHRRLQQSAHSQSQRRVRQHHYRGRQWRGRVLGRWHRYPELHLLPGGHLA